MTSPIRDEAEQIVSQRLTEVRRMGAAELRRHAGHTLVSETLSPSGRKYADQATYLCDDPGCRVIRAVIEVWAHNGRHGWSERLAQDDALIDTSDAD